MFFENYNGLKIKIQRETVLAWEEVGAEIYPTFQETNTLWRKSVLFLYTLHSWVSHITKK